MKPSLRSLLLALFAGSSLLLFSGCAELAVYDGGPYRRTAYGYGRPGYGYGYGTRSRVVVAPSYGSRYYGSRYYGSPYRSSYYGSRYRSSYYGSPYRSGYSRSRTYVSPSYSSRRSYYRY